MKILKTLVMILVFLLAVQLVSAFGISSMYHKNNPLVMYPGETKEIFVTLQNMVGGQNLLMDVQIKGGSLLDSSNEYLVPFGRSDIPVNLKVTIPEDAVIGETRTVSVAVKTIPLEEEGMLQMRTGLVKKIPILVGSEGEASPEMVREIKEEVPASKLPIVMAIVLGLVIIAAIVVSFVLVKKKSVGKGSKGRKKK